MKRLTNELSYLQAFTAGEFILKNALALTFATGASFIFLGCAGKTVDAELKSPRAPASTSVPFVTSENENYIAYNCRLGVPELAQLLMASCLGDSERRAPNMNEGQQIDGCAKQLTESATQGRRSNPSSVAALQIYVRVLQGIQARDRSITSFLQDLNASPTLQACAIESVGQTGRGNDLRPADGPVPFMLWGSYFAPRKKPLTEAKDLVNFFWTPRLMNEFASFDGAVDPPSSHHRVTVTTSLPTTQNPSYVIKESLNWKYDDVRPSTLLPANVKASALFDENAQDLYALDDNAGSATSSQSLASAEFTIDQDPHELSLVQRIEACATHLSIGAKTEASKLASALTQSCSDSTTIRLFALSSQMKIGSVALEDLPQSRLFDRDGNLRENTPALNAEFFKLAGFKTIPSQAFYMQVLEFNRAEVARNGITSAPELAKAIETMSKVLSHDKTLPKEAAREVLSGQSVFRLIASLQGANMIGLASFTDSAGWKVIAAKGVSLNQPTMCAAAVVASLMGAWDEASSRHQLSVDQFVVQASRQLDKLNEPICKDEIQTIQKRLSQVKTTADLLDLGGVR